jgi:hypothetical protein
MQESENDTGYVLDRDYVTPDRAHKTASENG